MEYIHPKKALEGFPRMLLNIGDPLKDFKKGVYEERFRAYEKEHGDTMDAIEDAYLASDKPKQLIQELAAEFVAKAGEELEGKKNKRQQEEALMNYNMGIVIYVNPALLDHNKTSGPLLTEELLCQWKERFPKTNLKSSTFETINGGFKKRYCYITTAVCQSLGKPDDCYELELLREYRDGYLAGTEDGEALVRYYYDVAPTIVKHINREPESSRIYREIWQEYLSPCIRLIEKDEKEECRVLYQNMVESLAKKYFNESGGNISLWTRTTE